MNLVTHFVKGVFRRLQPVGVSDRQQGGFVLGGDELEFGSHDYLILRVMGMGGLLEPPVDSPLGLICIPEAPIPWPRLFLMLSMPRVTGPRLEQKSKAFSSVISPFSKAAKHA